MAFRRGAVAVGFVCTLLLVRAADVRALDITITNQLAQDAYFQFASGGGLNGTIAAAPLALATTYGGFQGTFGQPIRLNAWDAGRLLISVGKPLTTAFPAFTPDASGPDVATRWDKVEMTLKPNPRDVSQANLSAQDFFGLRLQLETFAATSNTPVTTLGWTASSLDVFTGLSSLSGNNTTRAIALGAGGVPISGVGDVVRVVNPSSVSGPAGYATFQGYLDSLKGGAATSISGVYFGVGGAPDLTTQSYTLDARVLTDGTLELTGSGNIVGATTIRISEAELLKPVGIYGANPASTVNGAPHANTNSVYDAIIRDILGGLNLGFVGSDGINPNTGNAYKDDPSDRWYMPPVPADRAFAFAQPANPAFFNQFAAFLSPISDAYGFAYTDLIQSPLADINSSRIDRLVITILSDGVSGRPQPVPEPGALVLFGIGLLGLSIGRIAKFKR